MIITITLTARCITSAAAGAPQLGTEQHGAVLSQSIKHAHLSEHSPCHLYRRPAGPFYLATEERGAFHRARLAAALEEEAARERAAREFRAAGLPPTLEQPAALPRRKPRASTAPQPFNLLGVVRCCSNAAWHMLQMALTCTCHRNSAYRAMH